MHRRLATTALLATLILTGCAANEPIRTRAVTTATPEPAAELAPLPPRGHLSRRAQIWRGPRVLAEHTHGRALTMFGSTRAKSRMLIAGCVNGTTCAGTDVVHAAMIECPPVDAELWYFPSLDPGGADLDSTPAHPGARAFRQAAADLRPEIAIVFRTGGPQSRVLGGESARRYARLARLPYTPESPRGLALPGTEHVVVELPFGRASMRTAARLAYAIDRLAGSSFARGADETRRRLIALGHDPRAQN